MNMVPISSKRRHRTNNESQAIISTESTKMIEVVSSNSHNTQDVDNRTTISTSHTNQTPTTVQRCSICNKNNARYKCPRCNISYCSVSCYQIHDGTYLPLLLQTILLQTTESYVQNHYINAMH